MTRRLALTAFALALVGAEENAGPTPEQVEQAKAARRAEARNTNEWIAAAALAVGAVVVGMAVRGVRREATENFAGPSRLLVVLLALPVVLLGLIAWLVFLR